MRETLMACVLAAACGANAAARPLAATREAVLAKGFTIDLKIDCGSVKGDEALYQYVLALPPLYRDTVLFTFRLAWQYYLFRGPWKYNHNEEQFASHCVIMALPKAAAR